MRLFSPLPAVGDIVWCRFPYEPRLGEPGPKPRPALVVAIAPGRHVVEVAYGTSQKVHPPHVYPGEFVMDPADPGFGASGLSYRTKFNLKHLVKLPFDSDWFAVAPGDAINSPLPKIGVLHASYYKAAAAAARG